MAIKQKNQVAEEWLVTLRELYPKMKGVPGLPVAALRIVAAVKDGIMQRHEAYALVDYSNLQCLMEDVAILVTPVGNWYIPKWKETTNAGA